MRLFAWLVCGGIVAYGLYNLQAIKLSVNETLNLGTLKGIENCVAYSSNDLVSAETTRNVCSARIQVLSFDNNLARGRAGPRIRQGRVFLEGELENTTSSHVTTAVGLYIGVHDKEGALQKHDTQTQIWIEPRASAEFEVEFPMMEPEQIDPIVFCEDDDDSPKSCIFWGVHEIRAVEI